MPMKAGKSRYSGNYDLLKAKFTGMLKARGVVPGDISVVLMRGKRPLGCYAINGITKEELGIVSRYAIADLINARDITIETDAAGVRWLIPLEE